MWFFGIALVLKVLLKPINYFTSLQFSVFLGIIFFLELTAGVLAFVFKDWIKDQLYFFINNNIRAYRDDIDLQNLIDFTQEYVRAPSFFKIWLWNLHGPLGLMKPYNPKHPSFLFILIGKTRNCNSVISGGSFIMLPLGVWIPRWVAYEFDK